MKVLVDDLLLLTRLESSPKPSQTEFDLVAIAPMLESIATEARQIIERQPSRLRSRPTRPLRLRGSEFELHSAFSNLVGNAVRYSPDGGDIACAGGDRAGARTSRSKITAWAFPAQHLDAHHRAFLSRRPFRFARTRRYRTGTRNRQTRADSPRCHAGRAQRTGQGQSCSSALFRRVRTAT